MGLTAAQMIERISSDQSLVKQFSAVYGSAPNSTLVSRALAMYIRGIFADSSPFDFGNMTALQRKGFNLFSGRANCIACHSGPNFTDERTHAIGLSPSSDEGGYRVKLKEEDRYSFKTPSLRGIAKTGPYMHDGRFETLEQVVEHYNRGGDNGTESYRSPLIRPLDLTDADKAALVEFLNALSGRIYDNAP